jgi:hypothetical protein
MRIINSIPKERIDEVLTFNKYFTHLMSEEYFNSYIVSNTDFDISFALLNENDEIVGVYLLNKSKIDNYVTDSTKFNGLKGVEGVLLCIQEDYRNHGWGNKLKDAPKSLDIDYIWGQQFKGLNNLQDWLKRRELIDQTHDIYITAEIFKK